MILAAGIIFNWGKRRSLCTGWHRMIGNGVCRRDRKRVQLRGSRNRVPDI